MYLCRHSLLSHRNLIQGIDAEYVPLDDIVATLGDLDSYVDRMLDQTFYDKLAVIVGDRVRQCGSRVPVVTGARVYVSPCTIELLTMMQAFSDQYQGHYFAKSAGAIQIYSQQSFPLACRPQSYKSGRKWTVSSLRTRARFLPPVSSPLSPQTKRRS
jgi:hypothetical protein